MSQYTPAFQHSCAIPVLRFPLHWLLLDPSRCIWWLGHLPCFLPPELLEPSQVSADSEGPCVHYILLSIFFFFFLWRSKAASGPKLVRGGTACSWRGCRKCCELGIAKGRSPLSVLSAWGLPRLQISHLIPHRNGDLSQFPYIYSLCPHSCHLCPSPMALSFWDS